MKTRKSQQRKTRLIVIGAIVTQLLFTMAFSIDNSRIRNSLNILRNNASEYAKADDNGLNAQELKDRATYFSEDVINNSDRIVDQLYSLRNTVLLSVLVNLLLLSALILFLKQGPSSKE